MPRRAVFSRALVKQVTIRLRDEEEWSVEPWACLVDLKILAEAQRDFVTALLGVLEDSVRAGYSAAEVSVTRVPYVAPDVQISRRMSLPLTQELLFSKQTWLLNQRFFNCMSEVLRVENTTEPFQALARYLGFKKNSTLAAVYEWHLQLP